MVSMGVGIVALSMGGCDQTPTTTTTQEKVEKKEPPPAKEEKKAVEEQKKPEYRYDPDGRREPFKSLIVEPTKVVDVIVTPPPDQITSPLQKFGLEELKLKVIILGGLGDYARVLAPDGRSYTINVGILMGRNLGKVISISENVVWVKETIRKIHRESGKEEVKEEVVETPIYLNPIKEEGKKP